MKAGANILFLQQKINVLQAAREFDFQLQKARDSFDYGAALRSMGNKAIGMRYFYDRSLNLINWIYCHSTFSTVLKQHNKAICGAQVLHRSSDLSSSFRFLQESALELLGMLNGSLDKLEEEYATAGLKWKVRNDLSGHKLGIDILKTIVWAKPEQYWIDLYEQGFSDRTVD